MQSVEVKEAAIDAMATQASSTGIIRDWEDRFAERTGASRAFAFGFARNALAATLRAAGLGPGDRILMSPFTCKVVPLAILAAGLEPAYVDICADTLNLDPSILRDHVGARTRALLFQRTYGSGEGSEQAIEFARVHDMLSIEDCAQCMPSAEAWAADAAIFSNNPGKPLPAGSGGMVVLRSAVLAGRVEEERGRFPRQGRAGDLRARLEAWVRNTLVGPSLYWPAFELNRRLDPSYRPRPRATEVDEEVNAVASRIGDGQAAAGLRWLAKADTVAAHRADCCAAYARGLGGLQGIVLPMTGDASLYFFPVLVDRKDVLLDAAKRARLEIVAWPARTPIYPVLDPSHLATYGYRNGSCPHAEDAARRVIGLPTHPLIRPAHIERIVGLVRTHAGSNAS
jgi:perosamine synthetase